MSNFIFNNKFGKYFIICLVLFIGFFLSCLYIKSKSSVLTIEKGPSFNYTRAGGKSLELKNGKVLFIGDSNLPVIAQKAELFDKNLRKFIQLPDTNYSHSGWLYMFQKDNKVLILDDYPLEIYDIDKNIFYKTDKCVIDKCEDENSKKYVKATFVPYEYTDDEFLIHNGSNLYFWNYKTGVKKVLPSLNIPRKGFHVLVLPNNEILLFSGFNTHKDDIIAQTEIYNPTENSFRLGPVLEIDSEIVSVDIDNYEIKTENYIYKYDVLKNDFTKIEYSKQEKDPYVNWEYSINNKYKFLFLQKCDFLFFCSDVKVQLYDKEFDKILDSKPLLFYPKVGDILEISDEEFLLLHNRDASFFESSYPIKENQIIRIKK